MTDTLPTPLERVTAGLAKGMAYITLLLGRDLTIAWISPSVTDLAGWEPDELVGLNALELVHPDDLPQLAVLLYNGVSKGANGGFSEDPGRMSVNAVRLRDSSGNWRSLEIAANNQIDNPEVQGFVCVMRESTERYLHEQIFRRLAGNADLERVLEAVAELLAWQIAGCRVVISAVDGSGLQLVVAGGDPEALGPTERFGISHRTGAAAIEVTSAHAELSLWCQTLIDRAAELTRLALTRDLGEAQLRRAALVDPLTGVANRAGLDAFTENLGSELVSCALYVDLDDFKLVNDDYGHHIGDLVLREVATRLENAVRSKDLVARVGGDEFVVICTELPNEVVAVELAHRMVAAVNRPFEIDGVVVPLGASVGLAVAGRGGRAADLIEPADEALRDAKRTGKHRLVSFAG